MFERRMIRHRIPVVCTILIMATLFSTACGSSLKGTYKSESGIYAVEFKSEGKCTWYQDGQSFSGTYAKDDDQGGYILSIMGSGSHYSTMFYAAPDGRDLIITGGFVYEERFAKE